MRDTLRYVHACLFQRCNLARIIGHQPDFIHAQQRQHAGSRAKIARFVGQAQPLVRIHCVKSLILQPIGAQLVDQANAAPFLPHIEQHAPAACPGFICHRLQGSIKLRPAIAFETAENIASQTFGMQADQRRPIG